MSQQIAIGIDFGTCSTSAALLIGDRIELVNLSQKQFSATVSMPTAVFIEDSGQILVGQKASAKRLLDSNRFQHQFKLEMERTPGRVVTVDGVPKMISWLEIVTTILSHVKAVAERDLNNGSPIVSAVLTVPALYARGGVSWKIMEDAACQAGFEKVEIIREPHAAALYYDQLLHQANRPGSKDGDQVLIYDLGGGTFDPALIRRAQGDYPVERAGTGAPCGGIFIDAKLRQDFQAKCAASLPVPPRRNTSGAVMEGDKAVSVRYNRDFLDIEEFLLRCKHGFSEQSIDVFSEDAPPLMAETYTITCQEFDQMVEPLLDQTLDGCESLLRKSGVSWPQLSAVVLVGGSCALPIVRERLASVMSRSGADPAKIVWQRISGTDILIDPGTAVCRGAVWHARNSLVSQRAIPTTPQMTSVATTPPQSPAPTPTANYDTTLLEAEAKARKIVNAWSAGAVLIGWIPFSMLALSAVDVALCRKVASCFHVTEWSKESVAAALGASVAGKVVAGEALSLNPFLWPVKSLVAGGVTKGVGEGIIAYFRQRSPLR